MRKRSYVVKDSRCPVLLAASSHLGVGRCSASSVTLRKICQAASGEARSGRGRLPKSSRSFSKTFVALRRLFAPRLGDCASLSRC